MKKILLLSKVLKLYFHANIAAWSTEVYKTSFLGQVYKFNKVLSAQEQAARRA